MYVRKCMYYAFTRTSLIMHNFQMTAPKRIILFSFSILSGQVTVQKTSRYPQKNGVTNCARSVCLT